MASELGTPQTSPFHPEGGWAAGIDAPPAFASPAEACAAQGSICSLRSVIFYFILVFCSGILFRGRT
jgi:hypothetical protein